MKKVTIFSIIAVMAILILSFGCKREDDKVLNVITVAGNTEAIYNADYIPSGGYYYGPFAADCNTTLYRSEINVSFETQGQLRISFFHPTNSTTIPTGTFNLADYCMEGFMADFYPVPAKTGGLCLSTGTIKVAKTGDIYDVDVNLVIHADCGGGTIKGNFNGTLDAGVN